MSNDKKRISVKIFGTEYAMVAHDNEEYIRNIALKVDEIMHEIAGSNRLYNPNMIAVLTALNFADALYKSQELLSETADKLENLQGEMQRPFEELNSLTRELEAIKEQYTKTQGDYTKTQIELGKISREWARSQEELRDARCECDVSKETINELQSKLFEHQIELLKAKRIR